MRTKHLSARREAAGGPRRLRWKIACLLLVLGLLAAACGSGSEQGAGASGEGSTQAGDNVIRIGAAISQTGAYAIEGEQTRRGYELWANLVNNELGGIEVGGETYTVEMIYYDDESNPETATRLITRLITEDGVDFIFGPYSSGMSIATSAITERNQVIMMAGGAAAESVFNRGFLFVFSPLTLTGEYTRSGLEALAEEGAETVGIVHMDDAPMTDVMLGAVAISEELGLEVVSVQAVPSTATDITGAMTQVQAANPDVFVAAGHTIMGILFTQTMRQIGWAPPYVLMIQAPSEPAFVEELGAETVEGIMGPTQWHQSADYSGEYFGTAQDYYDRFVEAYGEPPSYLPPSASAAALSLQIAIENAGTLDTTAVREALVEMEEETFYGPINYSGEDHPSGLIGANVGRPMLTIQLKDGEQVVVAPDDAANGEIVTLPDWSEK